MGKKDNINMIVGTLREEGLKPTYDNIHNMFHDIIAYIIGRKKGITDSYRKLGDNLTTSAFFSDQELQQISRIRFNIGNRKRTLDDVVSKVTNRVIEEIARRRKVNIQVNSKLLDDLPTLKVVHEGKDGKKVYRWNPDKKDTLVIARVKPTPINGIGDYVNLTEYCIKLQKSITDRYPNPELINFVNSNYKTYKDFNTIIRDLVNRLSIESIRYGISNELTPESIFNIIWYALCSEEPLKRDKNGLAYGLYIRKDELEKYLSGYKILVLGYDKPEDKPQQKKK